MEVQIGYLPSAGALQPAAQTETVVVAYSHSLTEMNGTPVVMYIDRDHDRLE